MQTIPLGAVSSQIVSAVLGAQQCKINVYQKTTGLFLDLYVNDALIIGGVVCLHAVKIVRDVYLGFVGDLCFFDTQGTSDPAAVGLGGRYTFVYFERSDL